MALAGSLLRVKEGSAVEGIGRFATVRNHQGVRSKQGVLQLKISITGNGAAGGCVWMSRQDMEQNIDAAVVGVMADSKKQEAERGRRAGSVSGAVQLAAVGRGGGIERICAVTMRGGMVHEEVMAVEAAVAQLELRWVPWLTQGGAAMMPAAAPPYHARVPRELVDAYGAEREGQGDRAFGFAATGRRGGVGCWPSSVSCALGCARRRPARCRWGSCAPRRWCWLGAPRLTAKPCGRAWPRRQTRGGS